MKKWQRLQDKVAVRSKSELSRVVNSMSALTDIEDTAGRLKDAIADGESLQAADLAPALVALLSIAHDHGIDVDRLHTACLNHHKNPTQEARVSTEMLLDKLREDVPLLNQYVILPRDMNLAQAKDVLSCLAASLNLEGELGLVSDRDSEEFAKSWSAFSSTVERMLYNKET